MSYYFKDSNGNVHSASNSGTKNPIKMVTRYYPVQKTAKTIKNLHSFVYAIKDGSPLPEDSSIYHTTGYSGPQPLVAGIFLPYELDDYIVKFGNSEVLPTVAEDGSLNGKSYMKYKSENTNTNNGTSSNDNVNYPWSCTTSSLSMSLTKTYNINSKDTMYIMYQYTDTAKTAIKCTISAKCEVPLKKNGSSYVIVEDDTAETLYSPILYEYKNGYIAPKIDDTYIKWGYTSKIIKVTSSSFNYKFDESNSNLNYTYNFNTTGGMYYEATPTINLYKCYDLSVNNNFLIKTDFNLKNGGILNWSLTNDAASALTYSMSSTPDENNKKVLASNNSNKYEYLKLSGNSTEGYSSCFTAYGCGENPNFVNSSIINQTLKPTFHSSPTNSSYIPGYFTLDLNAFRNAGFNKIRFTTFYNVIGYNPGKYDETYYKNMMKYQVFNDNDDLDISMSIDYQLSNSNTFTKTLPGDSQLTMNDFNCSYEYIDGDISNVSSYKNYTIKNKLDTNTDYILKTRNKYNHEYYFTLNDLLTNYSKNFFITEVCDYRGTRSIKSLNPKTYSEGDYNYNKNIKTIAGKCKVKKGTTLAQNKEFLNYLQVNSANLHIYQHNSTYYVNLKSNSKYYTNTACTTQGGIIPSDFLNYWCSYYDNTTTNTIYYYKTSAWKEGGVSYSTTLYAKPESFDYFQNNNEPWLEFVNNSNMREITNPNGKYIFSSYNNSMIIPDNPRLSYSTNANKINVFSNSYFDVDITATSAASAQYMHILYPYSTLMDGFFKGYSSPLFPTLEMTYEGIE